MNKTIYMTYKKDIPDIVFNRWKNLNSDYNIDFSLDEDCISFLKTHFNDYIVNLFQTIPRGLNKADLWRICKLYIHGGVYADVDLVPYINIETLDKDVTFYSCLAMDQMTVFQAFMVNFSKPKNPLLLHFLLSFLLNNPYTNQNDTTLDMLNCIQYNLNGIQILPETKYEINAVKIPVQIGSSETNTKTIDLHYFPSDIEHTFVLSENHYNDNFYFNIENNILTVTRVDEPTGWEHHHLVNICIQSKEKIFLFRENIGQNNDWITSFVSHNNNKILDSRDLDYYRNNGW